MTNNAILRIHQPVSAPSDRDAIDTGGFKNTDHGKMSRIDARAVGLSTHLNFASNGGEQ